MSHLTRTSLMLAGLFAVDKVLAILRQVIIARQFGLSSELDVFNVANNLPDLLFALISGGALAIAFIPVLSEALTKHGQSTAWELFSRIANLAFIVTTLLAIIIAFLADPIVRWELGIAPGFEFAQQNLVIELMRLNLISTLIFSISGLVMAGLQANQHFFLPALAPILYNVGQIFGALVLAPEKSYVIGGVSLPAFGLGVHGLVYGVILGASLHLAIQIPGLIRYKFRWIPSFGLDNPLVVKVVRLLGPRLITMLLIQLIFIVRDNLGSRLEEGAVTALAYGWMIQQVPETLIGTALGTAILPTLSEYFASDDRVAFKKTVERVIQILIGLTIPIAVLISFGLRPFISFAFGFDDAGTDLMLWVTRGYLVGLTGHVVLELAARAFYARQNAVVPLFGAALNVGLYILVGSQLFRPLGAAGVSLTDAIAFTGQSLFLVLILNRRLVSKIFVGKTLLRGIIGSVLGGGAIILLLSLGNGVMSPLLLGSLGMLLGSVIMMPFVWPEIKVLFKL